MTFDMFDMYNVCCGECDVVLSTKTVRCSDCSFYQQVFHHDAVTPRLSSLNWNKTEWISSDITIVQVELCSESNVRQLNSIEVLLQISV